MRTNAGAINTLLKKITVLLADDNRIVRRELRRILGFEKDLEVVGEAKNGREATDAGAVGYVIKQTCAECLGAAIHEVENGNTFYSGSIPSRLHKRSQKKQKRVTRITF